MHVFDEETATRVRLQAEYHFRNRAKFVRDAIAKDKDRMIDLAMVCKTNSMRAILKVESGDIKPEIVAAVGEVLKETSYLLMVSDDGMKVGEDPNGYTLRNMQTIAVYPMSNDVDPRLVYDLFSPHGKVTNVWLPQEVNEKNLFPETALVEFARGVPVEKFLNLTLSFRGAKLKLKPKNSFVGEEIEHEEIAQEANEPGNVLLNETALLGKVIHNIIRLYMICDLSWIRSLIRKTAIYAANKTEPNSDLVNQLNAGALASDNELAEVVKRIAVELHGGAYILKLTENTREDAMWNVVIDKLREKPRIKRRDIKNACQSGGHVFKEKIYYEVMNELCVWDTSAWVLKTELVESGEFVDSDCPLDIDNLLDQLIEIENTI